MGVNLLFHSFCLFKPGALDFLEKPTVAFVRLKESAVLDSALEAPLPVRFVFILVGPNNGDMDYHETGRAMAALMADKVSYLAGPTVLKCVSRDMLTELTHANRTIRQCFRVSNEEKRLIN